MERELNDTLNHPMSFPYISPIFSWILSNKSDPFATLLLPPNSLYKSKTILALEIFYRSAKLGKRVERYIKSSSDYDQATKSDILFYVVYSVVAPVDLNATAGIVVWLFVAKIILSLEFSSFGTIIRSKIFRFS